MERTFENESYPGKIIGRCAKMMRQLELPKLRTPIGEMEPLCKMNVEWVFSDDNTMFTDKRVAAFKDCMELLEKYADAEFRKSYVNMQDENEEAMRREEEQPNQDECIVVIPTADMEFVERKLRTKPSCWRKFDSDNFRTIFRKVNGKIMAYDQDYPQGREVKDANWMVDVQKSGAKEKCISPKGWLLDILNEHHSYLSADRRIAIAGTATEYLSKNMLSPRTAHSCVILYGALLRLLGKLGVGLDLYAPGKDGLRLLWKGKPDLVQLTDILHMNFHCFG